MKKILIIMLILITGAFAAFVALIWHAMSDMAYEMAEMNTNFFAQQVAVQDARITFNFDKLRYTSLYWRPRIVVEKPYLWVRQGEMTYRIDMPQIDIYGSVMQSHEYAIELPDHFILSRSDEPEFRLKVSVHEMPEVTVKSQSMVDVTETVDKAYLVDHFRAQFDKKTSLTIHDGNQQIARRDYDTGFYSPPQWREIHYAVAGPALQLIHAVEKLMHDSR